MNTPSELLTVARHLGELTREVVFVGGMVRQLLITDPAAGPARPTRDVDCVANVSGMGEYAQLVQTLRERGFQECTDEGTPLCRWVIDDVRVDVMPVDPSVLGFSNVWYPSALHQPLQFTTPDGSIQVVDAPHFCATKLESFLARADGDFYHHDLEDVLALVDARAELLNELTSAPAAVRIFVATQFAVWLENQEFLEALPGHLQGDPASQARLPLLRQRLERIAALTAGTDAESRRLGLVDVRSSNITSIAYDSASHVLTVEFHGGRLYAYDNVPPTIHQGLMAAASHGRFFHQWIKDRYPARRI